MQTNKQSDMRAQVDSSIQFLYRFHPLQYDGTDPFRNCQLNAVLNTIVTQGEPRDAFHILRMLSEVDGTQELTIPTVKMVEAVALLMSKDSVRKQWNFLSQIYRRPSGYPCCSSCSGYSEKYFLTPATLTSLRSQLPPKIAAHLLGIASFDPDGYIRQAALKEMDYLSDVSLPYVLLRLNDWVPEVRRQAYDTLHLFVISLDQFFWCRPLIEQLSRATRDNLKPIQHCIYTYIRTNYRTELMQRFVTASDWREQGFICTLLNDGVNEFNTDFTQSLLNSSHPEMRLWFLRQDIFSKNAPGDRKQLFLNPTDAEYKSYIGTLAHDRSSRVRYYALWHIEEFVPPADQNMYDPLFENALWDEQAKIRRLAQERLKGRLPSCEEYVQFVFPHLKCITPGVVKGIAEIDYINKEYWPTYKLIARLFEMDYFNPAKNMYRSDALYAAVLYAIDLLSPLNNYPVFDRMLLDGIMHPSSQIRKMATHILLKEKAISLRKELEQILCTATHSPIGQRTALKILVQTAGFEKTLYMLLAIEQNDSKLQALAWDYLRQSGWDVSFHINPDALERLSQEVSTLRSQGLIPPKEYHGTWQSLYHQINMIREYRNLEKI